LEETFDAHQSCSCEDLQLDEPRQDEVLVRVLAAGLSHTDLLARSGDLPGSLSLPAVLGREAAGVIERVGTAVTKLAPGDPVVVTFQIGEPSTSSTDILGLNLSGFRLDGSSPPCRRFDSGQSSNYEKWLGGLSLSSFGLVPYRYLGRHRENGWAE
jgi:aryl-alcohol dehydrogenase